MKVKDKDGNEVEISETEKIVTIAQQLSALGYSDVSELEESYKEKLSRLDAQRKADDEMIKRQGNELGELRKLANSRVETETMNQTDTPIANSEEEFGKKLNQFVDLLTEEERLYAEDQFAKNYEEATPEQRSLLKTNEGRAAFIELVFKDKSSVAQKPEISLFPKREAEKKSIKDQVAEAFGESKKKMSLSPISQRSHGIPEQTKTINNQKQDAMPTLSTRRGGGLRAMLKSVE